MSVLRAKMSDDTDY